MKAKKILQKARNNPANVNFTEMVYLILAFGFVADRIKGSHHVFVKDGIRENINIQKVGSKAKAYQVRQFLVIIDRYNLKLGDDT